MLEIQQTKPFSQNALNFFDEKIIKCPKCGNKTLIFDNKIGVKCFKCDFLVKIRSV